MSMMGADGNGSQITVPGTAAPPMGRPPDGTASAGPACDHRGVTPAAPLQPAAQARDAAAPAEPPDTPALAATRHWLERAVIGLNLCPFAKAPHQQGRIRWVESSARTPQALAAQLVDELLALAATDPAQTETTLLVAPHTLARFTDFNRFLGLADSLLPELRLDGVLQIASFHPQYRFAGTRAADITNATNRAPYPTLHLLREDSVARAVASDATADSIVERNMATLRTLGPAGWARLFDNAPVPGSTPDDTPQTTPAEP
jgi:hypothetical protein